MGSVSETNSSSSSSYSSDSEWDDIEIKLKLGGVISTFTKDGFWHHRFPRKSLAKQKLLNCRTKLEKLVHENEKLRMKFDILFDLAKSTFDEYQETAQEWKKLRNIWKKKVKHNRDKHFN